MYYEKLVYIREKLLEIFDKRGVYLDEEEWNKVIQFDSISFQALEKDLYKEFGVERNSLAEYIESKRVSLEVCEAIIWKMEKA